ncbi:GIY-YIG nuclease family protein [Mesobacillus subterraneus]|uniref:GIY-YIG nuclease family protein n=1 Tax=Mesobacillus subterraneus TaxID=285983 RepID=UPI001CFE7D04|nr:GIY-YIG nuclease family protein [Mesobacillus subterraneus]WLR57327.1 GIY-YIG nuclease family protein [Mesobacillus subterraneus]
MIKKILDRLFKREEVTQLNQSTPKFELYQANRAELDHLMKKPFPEGKAPGYVYFVQEHLTGTFNIGKTKNITKRMNVYHIKLPIKNELLYFIKSGNHHQTKAAFHKHFAEKQIDGEWFKLTNEDLEWIKSGTYSENIKASILDQGNEEDEVRLNDKQQDYALSLIQKLGHTYQLACDPSTLTVKDLNRLTVYFKYKNEGALVNLVKKGVLKRQHVSRQQIDN